MVGVIKLLVALLCLEEMIPNFTDELITILDENVHGLHTNFSWLIGVHCRWISTIYHLKWRITKRCLEGSVIAVFCPRQPL
jgi:hypothetical protein